ITRSQAHYPPTPSLHDALPISGRQADPNVRPVVMLERFWNAKIAECEACLSSERAASSTLWIAAPFAASADQRLCPQQPMRALRSEEHTSELQSLRHLVCRLLL